MADAIWATKNGAGVRYHTVTINSTDNDTEVLLINPNSSVSITMDVGVSESLSLKWSTAENPATANMLGAKTVTADYEDVFMGAISGIKINGAVTNATTIYIIEK